MARNASSIPLFRTDPNDYIAVTGTDTYYSTAFQVPQGQQSLSVQTFNTGDASGTTTPQVSNKPDPALASDSDWTTLPSVTVPGPDGSAGNGAVSFSCPYRWFRIKYVNSSGSGNLSAFVNAASG
jgi:hypothetical protein